MTAGGAASEPPWRRYANRARHPLPRLGTDKPSAKRDRPDHSPIGRIARRRFGCRATAPVQAARSASPIRGWQRSEVEWSSIEAAARRNRSGYDGIAPDRNRSSRHTLTINVSRGHEGRGLPPYRAAAPSVASERGVREPAGRRDGGRTLPGHGAWRISPPPQVPESRSRRPSRRCRRGRRARPGRTSGRPGRARASARGTRRGGRRR